MTDGRPSVLPRAAALASGWRLALWCSWRVQQVARTAFSAPQAPAPCRSAPRSWTCRLPAWQAAPPSLGLLASAMRLRLHARAGYCGATARAQHIVYVYAGCRANGQPARSAKH
jgi:hypothetical protein